MPKNQRPNQVNDPWCIPAVLTGKPEFGAPNCPVRVLKYYHIYMTEHPAVATSLQLFNTVDLQAVMKAGRWSSRGTITSFYLRDLCPQADSRPIRKTGLLVAAG